MSSEVTSNAWFRDVNFTFEDWQSESDNGNTRSNYMAWVLSQYETHQMDVPVEILDMQVLPASDGLDAEGYADVSPSDRERYDETAWREEVDAGDTRLGYEAWLMHQVEASQDDED